MEEDYKNKCDEGHSVCARCGAKIASHPSGLCYGCFMLSDR